MKKLLALCLIALMFCLGNPVPAYAHHGYAAYDLTKILSLKGTVTDYELQNPHSTISFDVKDKQGKVERWVAEAGHVRLMRDEGWTSSTLKVGDVATFYVHPAKNGSHAVDFVRVEFADGHSLWAHTSADKAPAD